MTGSPAADADSLAACLAYAWLLQLQTRGGWAVPYAPIPRSELRLRTEVLELFRAAGLDPRRMLFRDEVRPEELAWLGEVQLSVLDSDGAHLPDPARARIVEILDHHLPSTEAPSANRTFEPVGSVCTLVAERFFRTRPQALNPALARLLQGAILLDTAALDPAAGRAVERDREAVGRLAALSGLDPAELYRRLEAARRELTGLSTEELLRRDCKEAQAGVWRYGISSVPLSRKRWLERDPLLDEGVRRFREARGLDVLLVMIGFRESGFLRELGLCARRKPLAERIEAFLRGLPLGLAELSNRGPTGGEEEVRWFRQGAPEYARKRLQPLLDSWLRSLGPLADGGER